MLIMINILKIDATILAGILILLTIMNLEDDYATELENLEIEHLSFLNSIEKQTENLKQITERYYELNIELNNPELTREQFDKISKEIDRLSVLLKLDDSLYSLEYLTQIEREYQTAKEVLEYKISQENNKNLSNDPTAWIYYVGIGFSLSAAFALLALICEYPNRISRPRFHYWMSNSSVAMMLFGFLSLTVMFVYIGLS